MHTILTAHGHDFTIEGSDFGGNEADFQAVADAIAEHLATLQPAEVQALHTATTFSDDGATDDAFYQVLATTCDRICRETLTAIGWAKPGHPHVSISALVAA